MRLTERLGFCDLSFLPGGESILRLAGCIMKLRFLIPLIGYLLGSIPFFWLSARPVHAGYRHRWWAAGNFGATNVYRRNRWAGVLTLLLDGGKG